MKANKRKLALLLGAAMAVMAFAAPGASATEVRDAQTGELCPEVKPAIDPTDSMEHLVFYGTGENYESGGCAVTIESPVSTPHYVAYGGFGSFNKCSSTLDLRIGPDGWGYVNDIEYHNCELPVSDCTGTDRIVAPREYNPFSVYMYASAGTRFNIGLCAYTNGGHQWGLSSFQLGKAILGQAWMHEQAAEGPHGPWYFITGSNWYHVAGSRLTVG